jgi:hypothetical protein
MHAVKETSQPRMHATRLQHKGDAILISTCMLRFVGTMGRWRRTRSIKRIQVGITHTHLKHPMQVTGGREDTSNIDGLLTLVDTTV